MKAWNDDIIAFFNAFTNDVCGVLIYETMDEGVIYVYLWRYVRAFNTLGIRWLI